MHVSDTALQICRIHNEINSVKRCMLNGQIHEDRISTLSENVSGVQTELCNQIKHVQKKFKSFDGLLI